MKKIKLILPLLLLVFLLSGCGALDEMRAQHALDYGNGLIVYNGQNYKRVNDPEFNADELFYDDPVKSLYITAPDVPVLLSQAGIHKFLPYINSEETVINDCLGGYYIREDRYDEIYLKVKKK